MTRYLSIIAAFVFLYNASVDAKGLCYDSYNFDSMDMHFATIKTKFPAVRTYQTRTNGSNCIDVAAKHGLLIYAGVWIRSDLYKADLDAAIEGAKRHPESVKAIFIGNEDMSNGWSPEKMKKTITEAKQKIKAIPELANIPVGTVQTDGDWIKYPGVAEVCDIVGVNIYAFFDPYDSSTINNVVPHLQGRWNAMVSRFGSRAILTETGWPTGGGGPFRNHQASLESAIKHYWDVQDWMDSGNGGEHPMYFMFHDNPSKSTDLGVLFEDYFGLAYPNGVWKFDLIQRPVLSPLLKLPFRLAAARNGYVLHADGGLLTKAPLDDFHDRWYYNVQTQQIMSWNQMTCLDAFWDRSKLTVHLYGCNPNNNNQKWIFSNNQIKHEIFSTMCLDSDAKDEQIQIWPCGANNPHQIFQVTEVVNHLSLVTMAKDRAFVVRGPEAIGFQAGSFRNAQSVPLIGKWRLLQNRSMIQSESNWKCLDAYGKHNGAPVHMWPCDGRNGNQQWIYDLNTQQLRHKTHVGFCLDMGSYAGTKPHLWQCHPVENRYARYQRFQLLA